MTSQQKALVDPRNRTQGASQLSAAQKAAIVLASLGPEIAGPVMQAISDRHLLSFIDAIGRLRCVSVALRQQVVVEFIAEVERRKDALPGGANEARRILAALGDDERIARLLGQPKPVAEVANGSVWARIATAPEDAFVRYLSTLSGDVAAIILRQLPFEKISSLMALAEPDAAKELLSALSRESAVAPDVIEALAEAVDDEFLKPLDEQPVKAKVSKLANEVVSLLPVARRDELMRHLEDQDPEAAAEIRGAMITFEGLPEKLDEAGAAALLRDVAKETMLVALLHGKKSAPKTVEFLMANVSKRMAQQYADEMEELAQVPEVEGEAAQRKVCSELRRMIRGGQISIR